MAAKLVWLASATKDMERKSARVCISASSWKRPDREGADPEGEGSKVVLDKEDSSGALLLCALKKCASFGFVRAKGYEFIPSERDFENIDNIVFMVHSHRVNCWESLICRRFIFVNW
jgi:hypothetical protein